MPKDPSTKKKDNKEITNTKSPKQLNTETTTTTTTTKQLGEKKKNPQPMLQKWKTIEPVRKKKLPFVNFQSHFLTTSPLWIKYTNTNKKNNWIYLPSMKSLSGSDLLKYALLPSFLAFFRLSICIFLSSCNSFGISSNILKFVS